MLFAYHFPSTRRTNIVFYLLILLSFSACRVTKSIPEGERLLTKNVIEIDKKSKVGQQDITDQIRLRPNRKLLFFKFHLRAYQLGLKKIGEPPVLVDSAKVDLSAQNVHLYLFKKGYFKNQVSTEIVPHKRKKKAKVFYRIEEGPLYRIDTVELQILNRTIDSLVRSDRANSFVKVGDAVDYDNFDIERRRLSEFLRNSAYYDFNKSLVEFQVDTTLGAQKVRVAINVFEDQSKKHETYVINKVMLEVEGLETDSKVERSAAGITYKLNSVNLHKDILDRSITLLPDEKFAQKNIATTYEKLINLNVFQSVDIQLVKVEGENELDVFIKCVIAPKYDLTLEPQFVTTEQRFNEISSTRNYGLAGELSLRNKNLFGNAEELNLRLRGALETQFTRDSNTFFNTFVFEASTEYKVPKLVGLNSFSDKVGSRSNSTRLSLSYLFEKNQYYTRHLLPVSYTYEFVQNKGVIYWTPAWVSLNKATFNPLNIEDIDSAVRDAQERIFTNNFITSHKLSAIFTGRANKSRNYWTINTNIIELAGLLLPQATDYGELLGVNHSTFIRSDVDLRYHYRVSDNSELVGRVFGGVGVPIGERSILPFERRFFAGGSNSLRAWRLRTVGPGSYSDSNAIQFNRSGEISLMGNIEHRFDIIEAAIDLEGAVFFDFGNVWNLKVDSLYPGGEFEFRDFYKEFAINTGLGLRFDFDFLLLRLDVGIPLWDPNYPLDKRWIFVEPFRNRWMKNNAIWNLAVGYPFN